MSRDLGIEELLYTPPGGDQGGIHDPADPSTPSTFEKCQVFPRRSTEATGRESTTIVGMTALIPDVDAELDPDGTLTWRGKVYKIDGEPGPWRFMDGEGACLEVAMRRAQG